MRSKCLKLALLTAVLTLAAGVCSASVVTVSESSYAAIGGWSWTTNFGTCFFSNAGPCLDEGAPFILGSGAFYAYCGYGTAPPPSPPGADQTSTNWIGTDTHAGQSLEGLPLSKIKKMQYSTYVSKQWTMKGGANEWKWPRMPFQLQITFYDSTGSRRQVWHRPWGTATDPRGTNYSSAHTGIWEDWDAYNDGLWYECTTAGSTYFYGRWTTGDPQNPGVIEKWPGATLVVTSTAGWDFNLGSPSDPRAWRSAGWDKKTAPTGSPSCTATGKCINFVVGARKGSTTVFGSTTPAWYTESIGFKGYVDNFTLGIDFDDDGLEPEEEVTYDFETEKPPARIVALNNQSLYVDPGNPKHLFRFKIFGKVLESYDDWWGLGIPDPTAEEFWIWDGSFKSDGSGRIIPACWQVVCKGNSIAPNPGDYVSAVGRSDHRFYFRTNPRAFWTNIWDVVTLHQTPM